MQMLRQVWDTDETDACAWKVSINQMLKNIDTKKSQNGQYRIYSNKRRIWDKNVNKCRPRISAAFPMRRLFEEFRIT